MAGPLHGIRIIELAGVGPGPFAAMMFADHGAQVVRIERAGRLRVPDDPIERGRVDLDLDLREAAARDALLALAKTADALIDPYRPGRIEALGIGPAALHAANPRLVIGRITGYGQTGPMSQQAGHDINYLAFSGLLHGIGAANHRPVPPANLLADYGGGAMMLCFGMLAALLEVRGGAPTGRIVDAAMTEGTALLGTMLHGLAGAGLWKEGREANVLDGGNPFYRTYRCSDDQYLAVGALEPAFRAQLLQSIGLAGNPLFENDDPALWDEQAEAIAEKFVAEPASAWLATFEGKDACVAPVPPLLAAMRHPHHEARGSFASLAGRRVPAPAPRYGDAAEPLARAPRAFETARVILLDAGLDEAQVDALLG